MPSQYFDVEHVPGFAEIDDRKSPLSLRCRIRVRSRFEGHVGNRRKVVIRRMLALMPDHQSGRISQRELRFCPRVRVNVPGPRSSHRLRTIELWI